MFAKNKYKSQQDESLMQLLKKGNTQAFDELYNRYSNRLLHYFYRMLGNNEEKAQDFLQDLFLKVVEKPELFDTKKRFSTWLFTVASNMCKNEYRRLSVRANGSTFLGDFNATANDIVMPNIDRLIDAKMFNELLLDEVATLSEIKRDTFLLRYQEHFSIKEISEILNCSEGTVKSRLFYTIKKLAQKLQAFNPSISS
jgi:RNA polymerase sigma-70 factor (ECF subfamily)